MNPAILLVGVGALLLAGGRKKKGSSVEKPEEEGGSSPRPGGGGAPARIGVGAKPGKPWDTCDPPKNSRLGTYAAYGSDGKCMVFWDKSTGAIVRSHIDAVLANMSNNEKNSICNAQEDGYSQTAVALAIRIIKDMYPQLSEVNFPPDPDIQGVQNPDKYMKFFPRMVWTLVYREVLEHACGYQHIT